MNGKLIDAYREARALGMSATSAVQYARALLRETSAPAIRWTSGDGSRVWGAEVLETAELETPEGFHTSLELIADEDAGTSHLGEFYARGDYPSGPPRAREYYATEYTDMHRGGTVRVWYVPYNTYREARAWYLANKYGRAFAHDEARRQVFEDMRRLKDVVEMRLAFVGVRARVSYRSEQLAEVAVWGVEYTRTGAGRCYIDETAREEMAEALAAARAALPGVIAAHERAAGALRPLLVPADLKEGHRV